jgi:hypothetical protein
MAAEAERTAAFFSESQFQLITSILNRIIPASGDLPGAGELGVAHYLDGVIGPSAELKRTFAAGLTQITLESQHQHAGEFSALSSEQQDALLRHVEVSAPAFFSVLVFHTYRGYYSHPLVLQRLGLEARPPQPRGHHLEPFDLRLLDTMRTRAPLYRRNARFA